ncbi:hypothetical protein [Chlamydia sp. 17-3921]|nr:hypothetical protein [Chlamydia sp. 17-3921]
MDTSSEAIFREILRGVVYSGKYFRLRRTIGIAEQKSWLRESK